MDDDLFDWFSEPREPPEPRARRTDTWTSHAAAKAVTEEMARKQYVTILATLRRYGPGTFHQIAARCSLTAEQVHRRLPEMEGKSWVWRPGETAPGPSNRQCKIWHERKQPEHPPC